MKQYQKALIVLQENATAKSKQNKLVKLKVESEDTEFIEILNKLIVGYSYYIEPRWSRQLTDEQKALGIPSTFSEWKVYMNKIRVEAAEFLEGRIAQCKPQWQIVAEKNGWAPK